MIPRKKNAEQPLLQTVEEATELLRGCDARAWVWWFGGTAPFAIGLLYFTSDMSRAAQAESRLAGASLLLGLLYWWMKVAQSVFSDHLLRRLRGDTNETSLPFRGKLRFLTSQALIHCSAPWVLVLAFIAMVPFGWAYAGYHNVSILALSVFRKGGRTRDLFRTALVQSHYRSGQNHGLIMLISIFAVIIWINWFGGLILVAKLMNAVTGEENPITRNPMMLLSTGIMTATVAASYLVVGPFVKALYVLRCFYSLSRKNGEDLAVAFRRAAMPLVAVLLWFGMASDGVAQNEKAREGVPNRSVAESVALDPELLDRDIQAVLKKDVFQWRMPREHTKERQQTSWFESFLDDVRHWIQGVGQSIGNFCERFFTKKLKEWLRNLRPPKLDQPSEIPATYWADMAQTILKGLLAVLGGVVVILLIRQWRNLPPPPVKTTAVTPEVNLESDQVVATQLPENEWLQLAEEKMNSGEFRLAMRALFLATLAHLGERKLLIIRRSKSNGDYVRELTMRARDRMGVRESFSNSVRSFDWAWYGWHDVSREMLEQFRENHQRIINDGQPS